VNKEWPAAKFCVSVDQVYVAKHRVTEMIKGEVIRLETTMIERSLTVHRVARATNMISDRAWAAQFHSKPENTFVQLRLFLRLNR